MSSLPMISMILYRDSPSSSTCSAITDLLPLSYTRFTFRLGPTKKHTSEKAGRRSYLLEIVRLQIEILEALVHVAGVDPSDVKQIADFLDEVDSGSAVCGDVDARDFLGNEK